MTRGFWTLATAALVLATVVIGWFAANAPEVARPSLIQRETVTLREEAPPLPPAPYTAKNVNIAEALSRRALFSRGKASASGGPARLPARGREPMARTVLAPPTLPPARYATYDPRTVNDAFRARLALAKPSHRQYFGGHLMSPESQAPDPSTYVPADGIAPDFARTPRINPKRPEAEAQDIASRARADDAQPAEEKAGADAGAAPAGAAAEIAAAPAGGGGASDEAGQPEDMILLGVFQSRGAERALVRTATSGNVRVRPGDEIDGWRVSAIGEDNIQLRRASKTRVLHLPKN